MISEDEIRETIYHTMLGIALRTDSKVSIPRLTGGGTGGVFVKELLEGTVQELCGMPGGFQTIRGNKVTSANVAVNFRELFVAIDNLRKLQKMPDRKEQHTLVLGQLVEAVSRFDTFKKIIVDVINFYVESQKAPATDISAGMIRGTFYNIMVEQVVINKKISRSALVDLDSFVFYDLSAFVILDVVLTSLNYKGILLHNQSVVTHENCPAEFKNFYNMVAVLKGELGKVTKGEIEVIRACVSSDPEFKLTAAVESKKTTAVVKLVTIIKDLAIQISQNEHFREVINQVIKFAIEAGVT
ncbi:MAG: hypothetical protein Hyperionvirus7_43 [Hyperionvirus sp.]|uniref:Uncharacterized protein n=1 Tax=Hyperionvirus sp. TaxID=2487770 RepID=A0A3G5A8S0_9VIRU|nr:MAG: hypothetical protein Hyperionvirus7_43 [Hyperionvirus sp.]